MAGGKDKGGGKPSIVIRKEEVVEGGHHGGAWKVAYADFVTAMMAFFLLMWLLNATTAEQRSGIADYFSPSNTLASVKSGFGAPFGGHTPNDEGSLASDRGSVTVMNEKARPVFELDDDDSDVPAAAATMPNQQPGVSTRTLRGAHQAGGPAEKSPAKLGDQVKPASAAGPEDAKQAQLRADAAVRAEATQKEHARFEEAAQQIRDQVAKDPALAELGHQLAIDITPEGLRIQMLDEDKQPMFATGSSVLNDRARALLLKVAPILMRLPESLSITGHTDATPFRGADRSNWELSAERANATRRLLAEAGVPEAQVKTVSGQADRDPLLPAEPLAAANRRIAIVVLRSIAPKAAP